MSNIRTDILRISSAATFGIVVASQILLNTNHAASTPSHRWPCKGRVLELATDEVVIGRDPTNQLVLNDRSASRRHAAIRRANEGFKIVDLGSQIAKVKLVRDSLAAAGNNVSEATRMLGIHPNNLHRLMRNLGLKS